MTVGFTNSDVKRRPSVRFLRSFGHHWIEKLDPNLLQYLNGKGGDPGAPWVVTEPKFVKTTTTEEM